MTTNLNQLKKQRYALVPQMRQYDSIGIRWLPFLMFFNTPGYRSAICNTDRQGFRRTEDANGESIELEPARDTKQDRPAHLMVGGSAVFGVGCTGDSKTLPSCLNREAPGAGTWLNFGGRSLGSTQELLLFQMYGYPMTNLKSVCIFSGINDITLFFMVREYPNRLGTFFSWSEFNRTMNDVTLSPNRKILKWFLNPWFGDRIDYSSISIGDLLHINRHIRERENRSAANAEGFHKIQDHHKEKGLIIKLVQNNLTLFRDLCSSRSAALTYVLQPFASWIQRKPSPEEAELFSILDQFPGNNWRVIREEFTRDLYQWYATELEQVCNHLGIRFLDMNKKLEDAGTDGQWLFVDRTHLTDAGNRQVGELLKKELNLCGG